MRRRGSVLRFDACVLAISTMLLAATADAQELAGEAPAPAAAAQSSSADDAAGTKVPISLDDLVFERRLPFDVPFYVTGTPPDFVTNVTLLVYRAENRDRVSALITDLRQSTDCVPSSSAPRNVSKSAWRKGSRSTGFTLLVDALDPQRYYLFCFILTGPVPIAEIEVDVRAMLAGVIALMLKPEDERDLSVEMGQAFQARLADGLNRIGGRRSVPAFVPVGNIFHPSTRVVRGTPFAGLFRDLAESYQGMLLNKGRYDTAASQLRDVVAKRGKEASSFVAPSVIEDLTRIPISLPSSQLAITSTTPFDVTTFNFRPLVDALESASKAATAKSAPEAAAILAILDPLRQVQAFASAYATYYEAHRAVTQKVLDYVALEAREVTVSLGSSVLSADLSRNAYVSLDAGIAYSWRLENMVFYAGTNIYFRPINKSAPLRYKGSLAHRLALTIGVTTTVHDKSRRAEDLRPVAEGKTTSNSLLLGGGLRVTPSIRLGSGVLVFKESDPNPLITQTSVAVTPYVSLTADVNVAALLKSFFPAQ